MFVLVFCYGSESVVILGDFGTVIIHSEAGTREESNSAFVSNANEMGTGPGDIRSTNNWFVSHFLYCGCSYCLRGSHFCTSPRIFWSSFLGTDISDWLDSFFSLPFTQMHGRLGYISFILNACHVHIGLGYSFSHKPDGYLFPGIVSCVLLKKIDG